MTKLYYHKTDGGAEYLTDTFIKYTHRITGKKCKEGVINDKTKYVVRIDGDIEKDVELIDRDKKTDKELEQYLYQIVCKTLQWAEVDMTDDQEDIWNFIMLDLLNIK